MTMAPRDLPHLPRPKACEILLGQGVDQKVAILGVRGYYRNSMGSPGQNDRGIYDDAIFVVTPDEYLIFTANTDPSVQFKKGVATLRPGLWFYKVGIHGINRPIEKRYTALVQANPVVVDRDGGQEDVGFLGINIHRGSLLSTSSLGCQTIYPPQWPSFIEHVQGEMKRFSQNVVPYLLVENDGTIA